MRGAQKDESYEEARLAFSYRHDWCFLSGLIGVFLQAWLAFSFRPHWRFLAGLTGVFLQAWLVFSFRPDWRFFQAWWVFSFRPISFHSDQLNWSWPENYPGWLLRLTKHLRKPVLLVDLSGLLIICFDKALHEFLTSPPSSSLPLLYCWLTGYWSDLPRTASSFQLSEPPPDDDDANKLSGDTTLRWSGILAGQWPLFSAPGK
jgi:hypothetical protein